MKHKQFEYKGFIFKENPLTTDWIVDLGPLYGVYVGTKSALKQLVDKITKEK